MRYASIDRFEYVNGNAIGVSLFVQGCPFHCKGCFNPETWDFDGGKEWDEEAEKYLIELISRPYIKRFTILGGEPLAKQNASTVFKIIMTVKQARPDIKVWLYSGFIYDEIVNEYIDYIDDQSRASENAFFIYRYDAIVAADVFVDGRYVEEKRDITLPFRGSENQRIIDINKTILNCGRGPVEWNTP